MMSDMQGGAVFFTYCNKATPFLSTNKFIGNKASTFNGQIGALLAAGPHTVWSTIHTATNRWSHPRRRSSNLIHLNCFTDGWSSKT